MIPGGLRLFVLPPLSPITFAGLLDDDTKQPYPFDFHRLPSVPFDSCSLRWERPGTEDPHALVYDFVLTPFFGRLFSPC